MKIHKWMWRPNSLQEMSIYHTGSAKKHETYVFLYLICKLGAPRRLEDSIKFNKIQLASIFTCLVYLNDLSFFLKRLLKVTKSSSDSRVFWDSLYHIFLLLTYLKPTKDSILATTYSPQIKLKIRWLNCLNSVIELL